MSSFEKDSVLTQRAQEHTLMPLAEASPIQEIIAQPQQLPPTSPMHGFTHAISQNSMFTAPPGSRFVLAPNASLSISIFHARNLDTDAPPKSTPYVRVIQGDFKYMSTSAHTNAPVWNETFKFPILNPIRELLIVELWDDKSFGKTLLGYFPIDLSLLPRGIEVDTWEKLSGSTSGELSVGLKANGFGLETLPKDYDKHYEAWRVTIPAIGKDAVVSKRSNPELSNPREEPGPYAGKSVPSNYVIDNGYVRRAPPSGMAKAIGKAKGLFGIGVAAR